MNFRLQHIEVMKPVNGYENDLTNPNYWLRRKYDGTRCLILKDKDYVEMIGRSFKNDYASNFPEIIEEIRKLPFNGILDTELTYFDKNGKDNFLTALASRETREKYGLIAKIMVIEIIEYNGINLENSRFEQRMELMKAIFQKQLLHIEVIEAYPNSPERYHEIVNNGGEGVVLVMKGSPYHRSKSSFWRKIKHTQSEEAIVIGCMKGNGIRAETFGSLLLAQVNEIGKLQYIGCTSGFDMIEQNELYRKMLFYKAETIPDFIPRSILSKVKFFCKPKIVVEVRYGNKTVNNHTRFPVFVRERIDKEPIECTINQKAMEYQIQKRRAKTKHLNPSVASIISTWLRG